MEGRSIPNREGSIPDIVLDVASQFVTLFRKEAQLAQAEVSEKVTQVAVGLGLVVGGVALLIPALVILLQAAVAAIAEAGLAQPWAALIVGGAALLIGLILAIAGISRFKAEKLVPHRIVHQFQRDLSVAKHQTG